MIKLKKALAGRLSYVPLIAFFLCQPLAGYQQGSYFLFYLTEAVAEKAVAGRIAISLSEIKSTTAKNKSATSQKSDISQFQTEITSLQSAKKGTQDLTFGASEAEKQEKQTESSFGESSFGEEQPAPSGFFFTY